MGKASHSGPDDLAAALDFSAAGITTGGSDLDALEGRVGQIVLEGLRERGHDDAATCDFLHRDLELPSPEQAQADRARVFSARYPGDHD